MEDLSPKRGPGPFLAVTSRTGSLTVTWAPTQAAELHVWILLADPRTMDPSDLHPERLLEHLIRVPVAVSSGMETVWVPIHRPLGVTLAARSADGRPIEAPAFEVRQGVSPVKPPGEAGLAQPERRPQTTAGALAGPRTAPTTEATTASPTAPEPSRRTGPPAKSPTQQRAPLVFVAPRARGGTPHENPDLRPGPIAGRQPNPPSSRHYRTFEHSFAASPANPDLPSGATGFSDAALSEPPPGFAALRDRIAALTAAHGTKNTENDVHETGPQAGFGVRQRFTLTRLTFPPCAPDTERRLVVQTSFIGRGDLEGWRTEPPSWALAVPPDADGVIDGLTAEDQTAFYALLLREPGEPTWSPGALTPCAPPFGDIRRPLVLGAARARLLRAASAATTPALAELLAEALSSIPPGDSAP